MQLKNLFVVGFAALVACQGVELPRRDEALVARSIGGPRGVAHALNSRAVAPASAPILIVRDEVNEEEDLLDNDLTAAEDELAFAEPSEQDNLSYTDNELVDDENALKIRSSIGRRALATRKIHIHISAKVKHAFSKIGKVFKKIANVVTNFLPPPLRLAATAIKGAVKIGQAVKAAKDKKKQHH